MAITPSNFVDSDKPIINPIRHAVLKVYTEQELWNLSKITRTNLAILVERRLKENPNPTIAELQGIRELVEDYLTHPSIERLQVASQIYSVLDSDKSDRH